MFSTYRSIAHHLKNQVSELKSIDRDKGQLENAETFESLVTPAALLDFFGNQMVGRHQGKSDRHRNPHGKPGISATGIDQARGRME